MVPWTLAVPASASATCMNHRVCSTCDGDCLSLALRFDIRPDHEPVRQRLYRDQNPLSVSSRTGGAKTVGQGCGNARRLTEVRRDEPFGSPGDNLGIGRVWRHTFRTIRVSWMPLPITTVGHKRTCDYNRDSPAPTEPKPPSGPGSGTGCVGTPTGLRCRLTRHQQDPHGNHRRRTSGLSAGGRVERPHGPRVRGQGDSGVRLPDPQG